MNCPIKTYEKDPNSYRVAADWWEEQGDLIKANINRSIADRLTRMKSLNLKSGDQIVYYSKQKIRQGKVVDIGTMAVNVILPARRNKSWVDALLIIGKVEGS